MGEPSEQALSRPELEEIYLRLRRPVYNVVYRWLWDREEADEVVQETFLRIWARRRRIRRETLQPLVYRIALNLAANRLRRRRFWKWVSLEALRGRGAAGPTQEGRLAAEEEGEILRRVIESLPGKLRRVVMLYEFSEMTYEEVGRTLGIAPGTVGSRRNTALDLMRRKFRNLTERRNEV